MFNEETSKIFRLMYSVSVLEYTYPFVWDNYCYLDNIHVFIIMCFHLSFLYVKYYNILTMQIGIY